MCFCMMCSTSENRIWARIVRIRLNNLSFLSVNTGFDFLSPFKRIYFRQDTAKMWFIFHLNRSSASFLPYIARPTLAQRVQILVYQLCCDSCYRQQLAVCSYWRAGSSCPGSGRNVLKITVRSNRQDLWSRWFSCRLDEKAAFSLSGLMLGFGRRQAMSYLKSLLESTCLNFKPRTKETSASFAL